MFSWAKDQFGNSGIVISDYLRHLPAGRRSRAGADMIRRMMPLASEQTHNCLSRIIDRNDVAGSIRITKKHSKIPEGDDDPRNIEGSRHHASTVSQKN